MTLLNDGVENGKNWSAKFVATSLEEIAKEHIII
jgi:hypothetical protein